MSKIKIYTVNGFYYTGIKVYPKNWKTKTASVKTNWRTFCDFYDPAGNLFEIRTKGMNHLRNLQERQKSTEQIVDDLREDLESRGYNPFDGTFMMDEYMDLEINSPLFI